MDIIHKLSYSYEKPSYEEKFRKITYPGIKLDMYLISNHGRVYNIKKKIYMKSYFDEDCHEKITLVTDKDNPKRRGNKSKHYFIHRLMAWEFLGPPPDEYHNIVNHKNCIPCCNYIHNLEWVSVLENTEHAKKHGLLNNSGIHAKKCKYSEKFIRKICSLFEDGYNNKEIFELVTQKNDIKSSDMTGIYQLINKLGKKICYWDIVSEYNYTPPEKFFECDSTTEKIRELILEGKSNIEILKHFGYDDYSNKKFYNKIIYERSKCKVLFNDYRKGIYKRNLIESNRVE